LDELIPLHLIGFSGSWFYGLIQFIGLAVFAVAGMEYMRSVKRRIWFFSLGYPLIILGTNCWVLFNEIFG
jgi:hypothetical protein